MNRAGPSRTPAEAFCTLRLWLWWSHESANMTSATSVDASLRPSRWRSRQVDRHKALACRRSQRCARRSAPDGRLEYAIGKNEARESLEMSKAVEQATAYASTDMSALSVTPFTVLRALASVLECSYCSLRPTPCRAQKDPCMTLFYPFTVRDTHRRLAGPAGDESMLGGYRYAVRTPMRGDALIQSASHAHGASTC